ncbi:hypothetical protein PFISCL1PPCAC_16015 [Pristionchus fissidentatus]|uniref:Peptidase S72 domain-containing protein n=1 Tax=Pristionchus fissidentatus TaxID=1538716 RepID=A0AAV5W2L3_9BILA|nr:hypothetical protein PFISCL1PPCAC_16015 [Pristionchus fissidentatus]
MRGATDRAAAMTRLPSLCLLLALTISTALAAPVNKEEVFIGEPREISIPVNAKVSGPIDMPLPSWIVREGDKLRLIAPPDADKSNIVVVGDMTMEVVVRENVPTGCISGDEWADAVVEGAPMEHWDIVAKMVDNIGDVSMDDVRILPYEYALAYRKVTERDPEVSKGDTMIAVKSKCGLSVAPVIEEMVGAELYHVSIAKGSIPSRSSRNEDTNSILSSLSESSTDEPVGEELMMKKETTTLPSTTTTRVSRSTPVALVSIKSIECKQGAYCEGELEGKTFLGGDGGIHTFDLAIDSISDNGGAVRPWVIKKGEKRAIGVIPLAAGQHTYRLMGEDKQGKKVSAPFSIVVTEEAAKNHQFKMTMHSLPQEPEFLKKTITKLAGFLRRNADEIRAVDVTRPTPTTAVISYWNSSLPTTSCPTKEVAQWLRVLHHKHGEELNNDFVKAFDNKPVIHPKRLEVQWLGACEEVAAAAAAGSGVATGGAAAGAAGRKKEGEEPTAQETEGSLSTLVIVVCLLALLLAVLIIVVCCVGCKRQKTHKGSPNDYMSKGTPVVFPDEVDDEHADIPASAPMLVKEERPPLRVSEHSNPLYKPPPPLTAHHASSPRPTPTPSSHKLPPPYVPP